MVTPYATAAQLYAQPNITVPDDSGTVDLMLAAATEAIDKFCNRPDGFLAPALSSTRLFTGSGLPYQKMDETVEVVSLEWKFDVADTVWTTISLSDVIGFQGSPDFPDYNHFPYHALMLVGDRVNEIFPTAETGLSGWMSSGTQLRNRATPNIRIGGRWGYADEVPSPVVQATITLAARWFKRGESFWADTAGAADFGSLFYRQEIDPDVKMMLIQGGLVRPLYAD